MTRRNTPWYRRLLARFKRAVPSDLGIQLEGRTLSFRGPQEFEAALRPRTQVTADTLRHLGRLEDADLKLELRDTTAIHKRLLTSLLRTFETGEAVLFIWREMDLGRIVDEQQWQMLIFALGDEERVADAYRRVAIVKYLEYLNARREALGQLMRDRRRLSSAMKETAKFDARELRPQAAPPESFTIIQHDPNYHRLPRGRAVDMVLAPGEVAPLFLAHRRMAIKRDAERCMLVDETGTEIPLDDGRYVIGRSQECDVVLLDSPADVSRRHLIIDRRGDEMRLTDTSSHGTYVIKRVLADTQTRH
jgi:hypothetical protein